MVGRRRVSLVAWEKSRRGRPNLAARGGKLVLRRGDAFHELPRVAEESGATAVYFTRGYEPSAVRLEGRLKSHFDEKGIGFKRYGSRLLREPEEMRTTSGGTYQVFTPFWRAFNKDLNLAKALPALERISSPSRSIKSDDISDWRLSPTKPDWSLGLADVWQPGEAGAHGQLANFAKATLGATREIAITSISKEPRVCLRISRSEKSLPRPAGGR